MTDTAESTTVDTATDAADSDTTEAAGTAEAASDAPEGDEDYKPPREKRYREERNEARQALAAAEARIAAMQLAEVLRLAGDSLAHPADLFSLSGNELADYLSDEGNVDPERVAADVDAILAERPGLRPNARAIDPTQGMGSRVVKPEVSWGGLFKS